MSARRSAPPSAPAPAATKPAVSPVAARAKADKPVAQRPKGKGNAGPSKAASSKRGAQLAPVEAPRKKEPPAPNPGPTKAIDAGSVPAHDEVGPRTAADAAEPSSAVDATLARPVADTTAPRPAAGAAPARPSLEEAGDVFSAAEPASAAIADLAQWTDQASVPPVARLALGSAGDRRAQEAAEKGAQSLLSSDYYVRQYGAHGMRSLSADVDEYGLDPHVEERARPWLETLCTRYFRLTLEGAQRIPARGRALLVANRAGALPWDGLMLRTALRMQRPELSPLRWLAEDSVIHTPFLGTFMNRVGAVRACPENAERLLGQDRLVAAFPEGAQGSQKLFKERYRLQRFGRGGYVKLALKLRAPILPTAIIGAEEVNPLLARFSLFRRAEGADFLPITPTFPWLGPLGLLPAPIKWRVIVGEPVDLSGYGPDAAEDALVVHRLNEQIRSILQSLIDQAHASRSSVLFG